MALPTPEEMNEMTIRRVALLASSQSFSGISLITLETQAARQAAILARAQVFVNFIKTGLTS